MLSASGYTHHMLDLDRKSARTFLLRYHFLLPARSLERTDIMTVANRLLSIQVDPLDIVGRNVFLVLQSRINGFVPADLDEQVYGEHRLVEAWDKMRCLVGRQDWWGLEPFRRAFHERWERRNIPTAEVLDYVRGEIRSRGEVTSRDLENKGTTDWRWSATSAVRAALELLFDFGELAITGRDKGRKIYSMMDALLSGTERTGAHASQEEYFRWHIERRVRSLGIGVERAGDQWLGIEGARSRQRTDALAALADAGTLARVRIEGVRQPCFVPRNALPLLDGISPERPRVSFLAPLDNVLWNRQLIEELFGFSYTWEVYKPAAEREYGYYVLPVLYGTQIVARWEPRRTESGLGCRGWWWEPPIGAKRADSSLKQAIGEALHEFARFLGRDAFTVESTVRRADATYLRSAWRNYSGA